MVILMMKTGPLMATARGTMVAVAVTVEAIGGVAGIRKADFSTGRFMKAFGCGSLYACSASCRLFSLLFRLNKVEPLRAAEWLSLVHQTRFWWYDFCDCARFCALYSNPRVLSTHLSRVLDSVCSFFCTIL